MSRPTDAQLGMTEERIEEVEAEVREERKNCALQGGGGDQETPVTSRLILLHGHQSAAECSSSSNTDAGQGGSSSTTGARLAAANSYWQGCSSVVAGTRHGAMLVAGAERGVFKTSGRCIMAAPWGEGGRNVRHVHFEGVDRDLQANKAEPKKDDGTSEGVGEKVMVLEKDIKVLKEKKETKEKLKTDIGVRKRKNLEEMRKVAKECKKIKVMENNLKKMETDVSAKLELKEEELKKVLENAVAQAGGPSTSPEGRHLTFLLDSIARKEASLECPVCLVEAAAPIFGCSEYHLVCGGCRGKVAACPTCRQEFGREGARRNRFAEREAEELEGMREELRAATS